MQPNSVTIRGLQCKVAHFTRFQTDYPFPPAKLCEEIVKRAGHNPHDYRSAYVHVALHDFGQTFASISDRTRKQTYDLTFAYEDCLDDIYAIMREIEADVARELESQRIRSLLDEDVTDD
jgi:hypothetical protein